MLPKKLVIVILLVVADLTFADRLIIETEFGKVKGQQKEVNGVKINSWMGVPYAASPTGDLRWKPPTDPQKWSDVKPGSDPFLCPESQSGVFQGDEKKCLQVNIWVPETTNPISSVMAWIHGGGNDHMGPNSLATDGSKLAARSATAGEAVIVVHIGYRLGALGFMAMPELTAESPNKSSGNYGLLDQMFALKWIKRNIHAFGGSKTPRVVVFGESAGAYDISALLASPLATGLFDGAILQSPYQAFHWKSLSVAEKVGTHCAETVGCQKEDAKATLACLRALPTLKLITCTAAGFAGTITKNMYHQSVVPNVDGYFLKCNPLDALHAAAAGSTRCGKLSQAPVIVGATSMEWSLFFYPGPTETNLQSAAEGWAQDIIDVYQSTQTVGTQDFAELYPVHEYTEVTATLQYAVPDFSANDAAILDIQYGDTMFLCAALFTSSALAVQRSRDAYLYLFQHWPSIPGVLGLMGPTHAAEIPYVFGNYDEYAQHAEEPVWTPTAFEKQLSQTIMDYWLNFARHLNPNDPSGKATWPVAGYGKKNNFIVFGADGAVASMEKPYHHNRQCEVWMSYTDLSIFSPKIKWKPATKPPAAAVCPKCGSLKSGKLSCCARGGSWLGECGTTGSRTWNEGIEACTHAVLTTKHSSPLRTTKATAAGCPKCGTVIKSGKRSCCSRGGSWFKKCGDVGDSKFDHTWAEGIQACQRPTKSDNCVSGILKCMATHGGKIEAIEKRLTSPKAMERDDDGAMIGSCPKAIQNRIEGALCCTGMEPMVACVRREVGDYKACKTSWNKEEPGFFDSAKTVMESFNSGGYCVSIKPNPPTVAQTPSGCPKCGTLKKSGKRSCCAPGAAWFSNCGGSGDAKFDHTWTEGIQACKAGPVCPSCRAIKKSGKLSCCSRGGSWFKKCGDVGDAKFDHTWAEGIQACQSQRTTMVPSGCPKCGTDKSGKHSCCSRGGSWFKKCGKPGDSKYVHTWAEGIQACKTKSEQVQNAQTAQQQTVYSVSAGHGVSKACGGITNIIIFVCLVITYV